MFSTDTGKLLATVDQGFQSLGHTGLQNLIFSRPTVPDPVDQFIIRSIMSFPGVLQIENSLGSYLQCNDQSWFLPLIREHMDAKSVDASSRLLQAIGFQANDLPAEPPCSSEQYPRTNLVWSLLSHRQH